MPISMLKIHNEMQELRKSGVDVTLKSYLETKMPEYPLSRIRDRAQRDDGRELLLD